MIGFNDDIVFINEKDFGTPVIIRNKKTNYHVTGIFSSPSIKAVVASGFIQDRKTTLLIASVDAENVTIRDSVIIKNDSYIVTDIENDGSGFCRLTLSKSESKADGKQPTQFQY